MVTQELPASKETAVDPATTSNAIAAMADKRFRIPGDVINEVTKEMNERERTALRWFGGYCRGRNLGPEESAQVLQKENGTYYSYASIYALLTGRRADQGVGFEAMVAAIERLRTQVEGLRRVGESGFIATRLYAAIETRCRRAFERSKILFIFGDSQIGKTESLKEYQRTHNHGETIFMSVPVPCTMLNFLEHMALSLGIPSQQRLADLRRRIIASFDKRMLLIVDEAHLLLNGRGQSGLLVLDFLRELYNTAGCGIVISMTNEGRDLFKTGPHSERLQQLWRRRITPLQLPRTVPADDLARFAEAHGLLPAGNEPVTIRVPYLDEHGAERTKDFTKVPLVLQAELVNAEGLGVWLTILQDAQDIAREQKKPMGWGAVIKAYCLSQADSEVWG